MKYYLVAGVRPNFMKVEPLLRVISQHNAARANQRIEPCFIHTGQHYDFEMSQVFFDELKLPRPDIHLGVGSGTHAEQTGKIMIELERLLLKEKPDLVIVVGDVNSTLAAALAAVKIHIPVAHVEAGLRSYDRSMPEEINRILTDAISDYLFTPSPDADSNLIKEGVSRDKIFCVGDVMVDSLLFHKDIASRRGILSEVGLEAKNYALLTMHRPSNVDDKSSLLRIITAIKKIARRIPVIFPVHPRTQANISRFGFDEFFQDRRIIRIEPLGYLDFLNLEMNARLVITDSGGMQQETTVLNVPCLSLRDTTERPITIEEGTNILVWNDTSQIIEEAFKILDGQGKKGKCPALWDGKAAERTIDILVKQNTRSSAGKKLTYYK
jgi:UDP-N-acetylglucosamine 2-epimerase (non-hydrolysing)